MSKKFLIPALLLCVYIPVVSMQVTPENYMLELNSSVKKLRAIKKLSEERNDLDALKNISILLSDIPVNVDQQEVVKEVELLRYSLGSYHVSRDNYRCQECSSGIVGCVCVALACIGVPYGASIAFPPAIGALFSFNSARNNYKKRVEAAQQYDEAQHIVQLIKQLQAPVAQKME